MATYTDNYQLTKPTYAEQADIGVVNSNMNIIDDVMHSSQVSLAPAYDSTKSYAEGDKVMYELLMYKCISPTTGVWDGSKWERTTASESGGGGSAELDILGEASGAVASFSDGASAGLAKCIAEIEPKQAGSGTPSPDNVRAISGSTSVTVTISDGETSTAKTTQLGQTVYGGQLNVLTGELVIDKIFVEMDDVTWAALDSSENKHRYYTDIAGMKKMAVRSMKILCSCYETNIGGGPWVDNTIWNSTNLNRVIVVTSQYQTANAFMASLTDQTMLVDMETPLVIQIPPTTINTLLGQNYISADTGDIDIVYVKASAPIQPNPTGTPTATLKKLGIEGTVFEVPSGGGGSSSGINYSTTEQVIGTWIDGKPLYMRTFDLGSDIQVPYNTFINTAIDAVDKKVLIDAFGIYSTGETFYPLVANINSGIIRLQACRDNQVTLVQYVTIKYTKITD